MKLLQYTLKRIFIYSLVGIVVACIVVACASIPSLIDFKKRIYRLCPANQADAPANFVPYGKACFRKCVDVSWFGNCKKYEVEIENLSTPEVHERFRNAGFKLMIDDKSP